MYEIIFYQDTNGKEPFSKWLDSLSRSNGERALSKLYKIQSGNLGDVKSIGGGVCEFRLFFDKGVRIYFGKDGTRIIVLLCGGDKSTQKDDIKKAKQY